MPTLHGSTLKHAPAMQAHSTGSPDPAPDAAPEPNPTSRPHQPQRSPALHSPTSSAQAQAVFQPEHSLCVELSKAPSPASEEVQGPSAQSRSRSSCAPLQPPTGPSPAPHHAQQHRDLSCTARAGWHSPAEQAADRPHNLCDSRPPPELPLSGQPASQPATAGPQAPQPTDGPTLSGQTHLPPQPASHSVPHTAAAALPAVQPQHAPNLPVTDPGRRLPAKPQLAPPGQRTPAGAAEARAAHAPTALQQAPTAAESHPGLQQPMLQQPAQGCRPPTALPTQSQRAVRLQEAQAPALLPDAQKSAAPAAAAAAAAAAVVRWPLASAAPATAGTKAAAAKRAQQARRRVLHSSSDESEAEPLPDSDLPSHHRSASESDPESEPESEQGSAYASASSEQEAAPDAPPKSLPRRDSEPSSVSIGDYRPSSASVATSVPIAGLPAPASGTCWTRAVTCPGVTCWCPLEFVTKSLGVPLR